MTNEQATYRRVLRRETHAPRTLPAVVVASVCLVLLIALIAGGIWWLVDPLFRETATAWFAGTADLARTQPAAITAGIVLVILALVLIVLAVTPGRRPRRARTTERTALLVDDGVIADSIADAVARRTGITRGQASVTVGRRIATVRITPTSGRAIDRAAAESAVSETVSSIGFAATPRIVVTAEGVIA